jgi:hypothetical protein
MDHVIFELEGDGMLRFARLDDATIACLEGALWITLRNDPRDITLEPGASCRLSGAVVLVQAVRRSRVRLETPSGEAQLGFARFRMVA